MAEPISMVYHGDTAFGEDIHNAGALGSGAWDLKKKSEAGFTPTPEEVPS